MKKFALRQFLVEYGRYYEPAALFYHRRIEEALIQFGFKVLSIDRLSRASRWQLRLKATLEAQAQVVGQTYRARNLTYGKATKLLESRLKSQLRSALNQLGDGISPKAMTVVRHGAYFQVCFLWPLGTPGKWRPPASSDHPFRASGMIRAWLKQQRN